VNVVLVEAKLDHHGSPSSSAPDPYVKFKLGSEKYKSKVQTKTFEPKWTEQFDMQVYDENFQHMSVMVQDRGSTARNGVIGKLSIDLSLLDKERTHELWHDIFEDSGQMRGKLLLLLTITCRNPESSVELANSEGAVFECEGSMDRERIERRYVGCRRVPAQRWHGHCSGNSTLSAVHSGHRTALSEGYEARRRKAADEWNL